jgi:hypothetical protein
MDTTVTVKKAFAYGAGMAKAGQTLTLHVGQHISHERFGALLKIGAISFGVDEEFLKQYENKE